MAVRDNDRAADAMGMDPGRTKLFAFALGAFYAGIAGVLYAYLARAVVIEDYTFAVSIKLLAMAIVGGLGTLVGSFLGPAFFFGALGCQHGGPFQPDQGPGFQRGWGGRGQRPQALGLRPYHRAFPYV